MQRHGLTVFADSPETAVLTLADAKKHLRVDHSDDDALIFDLIGDAIETAEDDSNCSFFPKSYLLTLPCFPRIVYLPVYPLIEVTGITYRDSEGETQTLAADQYDVAGSRRPPEIHLAYGCSWPATRQHPDAVSISFRAGYAAAPRTALVAIKLMLGHLYENREATAAGMPVSEIPLGYEHHLREHRLWRL